MISLILVGLLTLSARADVEAIAAAVMCAEAGSGMDDDTLTRATRVAHVIDHRVRWARRTGDARHRITVLHAVLTAKHQWSARCKIKVPRGGLLALAHHLATQKMHWHPKPAWLTSDVLYVIAEAESRKLGLIWGGRRCLVKVDLGQAFYEDCKKMGDEDAPKSR